MKTLFGSENRGGIPTLQDLLDDVPDNQKVACLPTSEAFVLYAGDKELGRIPLDGLAAVSLIDDSSVQKHYTYIRIPTRIMAEHMLKSVQRALTPEGRMKLAQKAPAAKERGVIPETEQKQSRADASLFITCGNCTVEFRKTDLPPGGKCPVCGKRFKVDAGKD